MDMKRWSGIILLGTAACLLGHSAQVQQAARDGLALCGASVIPALFPFFVVTGLAVRLDAAAALEKPMERLMGPLFRLSGACAAPLLAGLVGGYPTGARAAAELWREGRISREEAERLLGFCNNCGPGFILGFVGAGVFRESRTGRHCTPYTFCPPWRQGGCGAGGTGGRQRPVSPAGRCEKPPPLPQPSGNRSPGQQAAP